MIVDRICDYDEGYDRADAYEIGWCLRCRVNPRRGSRASFVGRTILANTALKSEEVMSK